MKNIINAEKVVKTFGIGQEKTRALDGVDVEIKEGEFVAVMGPSGSGKSTLLFGLSGTDEIDSGSVDFNGSPLDKLSENKLADFRRKEMGFVFQQPTMLKNLNLLDNIILPAVQRNRSKRGTITEKAKNLMNKAGIKELEKRDITQVSGGQLQRAGICRALISNPKIIFADEPTGALNSKAADEIMDMLSTINNEGTAIMLVTHDAKIAARADRVLFMKDGKVESEIKFEKFKKSELSKHVDIILKKMTEVEI